MVIGAAGAVFAARAVVLAPVRAAAALVAAKTASVETALATDGSASAPAETKAVPVGPTQEFWHSAILYGSPE